MRLIKIIAFFFVLFSLSIQAEAKAADNDGFYLDAGKFYGADLSFFSDIFYSDESNCYNCNYSGQFYGLGYDFNHIVSIEAKYAVGEESDNNFDLDVGYIGLNIGHDFHTGWLRLYGKAGYAQADEESALCLPDDCQSYTNSGFTVGAGARFTFSGQGSGLFAKVETLMAAFKTGSINGVFILGLGYRF